MGPDPPRPWGRTFIDLRDRSGIVQVVFNPDYSGEALQIADKVRSEYVLAVKGKVVKRDEETINRNLPTGEIEVQITDIEVLNAAKTPPFFIEDGVEVDESLRLKYRYLDLRRPEMQKRCCYARKLLRFSATFLTVKDLLM